jgi:hypothetical protein
MSDGADGKSPCPCIADGIAIATGASAGQNTLTIAPDKAPGVVMRAVIRHRKTNEAVEYAITEAWLPKILGGTGNSIQRDATTRPGRRRTCSR